MTELYADERRPYISHSSLKQLLEKFNSGNNSNSGNSNDSDGFAKYGRRQKNKPVLGNPAALLALKSCITIKDIAKRVGFPARTYCTAQLIAYRMHILGLHEGFDALELSIATLFISSKMEETVKKLKEIIIKTYFYEKPEYEISENVVDRLRHSVLRCEKTILKSIAFDFNCSETHKEYIKVAKLLHVSTRTASKGWSILTDSYQTTVVVEVPSLVLVVGSLLLALGLDSSYHESHASRFIQKVLSECDGSFYTFELEASKNSQLHYDPLYRQNSTVGLDETIKQKAQQQFHSLNAKNIDLHADWWSVFSLSEHEIYHFARHVLELYTSYDTLKKELENSFIEQFPMGSIDLETCQQVCQLAKSF